MNQEHNKTARRRLCRISQHKVDTVVNNLKRGNARTVTDVETETERDKVISQCHNTRTTQSTVDCEPIAKKKQCLGSVGNKIVRLRNNRKRVPKLFDMPHKQTCEKCKDHVSRASTVSTERLTGSDYPNVNSSDDELPDLVSCPWKSNITKTRVPELPCELRPKHKTYLTKENTDSYDTCEMSKKSNIHGRKGTNKRHKEKSLPEAKMETTIQKGDSDFEPNTNTELTMEKCDSDLEPDTELTRQKWDADLEPDTDTELTMQKCDAGLAPDTDTELTRQKWDSDLEPDTDTELTMQKCDAYLAPDTDTELTRQKWYSDLKLDSDTVLTMHTSLSRTCNQQRSRTNSICQSGHSQKSADIKSTPEKKKAVKTLAYERAGVSSKHSALSIKAYCKNKLADLELSSIYNSHTAKKTSSTSDGHNQNACLDNNACDLGSCSDIEAGPQSKSVRLASESTLQASKGEVILLTSDEESESEFLPVASTSQSRTLDYFNNKDDDNGLKLNDPVSPYSRSPNTIESTTSLGEHVQVDVSQNHSFDGRNTPLGEEIQTAASQSPRFHRKTTPLGLHVQTAASQFSWFNGKTTPLGLQVQTAASQFHSFNGRNTPLTEQVLDAASQFPSLNGRNTSLGEQVHAAASQSSCLHKKVQIKTCTSPNILGTISAMDPKSHFVSDRPTGNVFIYLDVEKILPTPNVTLNKLCNTKLGEQVNALASQSPSLNGRSTLDCHKQNAFPYDSACDSKSCSDIETRQYSKSVGLASASTLQASSHSELPGCSSLLKREIILITSDEEGDSEFMPVASTSQRRTRDSFNNKDYDKDLESDEPVSPYCQSLNITESYVLLDEQVQAAASQSRSFNETNTPLGEEGHSASCESHSSNGNHTPLDEQSYNSESLSFNGKTTPLREQGQAVTCKSPSFHVRSTPLAEQVLAAASQSHSINERNTPLDAQTQAVTCQFSSLNGGTTTSIDDKLQIRTCPGSPNIMGTIAAMGLKSHSVSNRPTGTVCIYLNVEKILPTPDVTFNHLPNEIPKIRHTLKPDSAGLKSLDDSKLHLIHGTETLEGSEPTMNSVGNIDPKGELADDVLYLQGPVISNENISQLCTTIDSNMNITPPSEVLLQTPEWNIADVVSLQLSMDNVGVSSPSTSDIQSGSHQTFINTEKLRSIRQNVVELIGIVHPNFKGDITESNLEEIDSVLAALVELLKTNNNRRD